MLELEAEKLSEYIFHRTINDKNSVSLQTILSAEIPTNVKTFLKAEVEFWRFQERIREQEQSRFHYNTYETEILQQQLDEVLIKNFLFSKPNFDVVVEKCVPFLFNYLCRPIWTLTSFLCEHSTIISREELQQKIRYCYDYKYFGEILLKFMFTKNKTELQKEEIAIILHKIEYEITKEYSAHKLAETTKPLFDCVKFIRSHYNLPMQESIPTRALMYFFDDREMKNIVQQLTNHRATPQGKEITFSTLLEIVEKSFEKKSSTIIMEEKEFYHKEISFEQEPFEKIEKTSVKFSLHNNSSLESSFSEKDKNAIIKNVFRKDDELYQTLIREITAVQTWKDASLTLDHFFTMNNIDPFTKEAILFINILQAWFVQRM